MGMEGPRGAQGTPDQIKKVTQEIITDPQATLTAAREESSKKLEKLGMQGWLLKFNDADFEADDDSRESNTKIQGVLNNNQFSFGFDWRGNEADSGLVVRKNAEGKDVEIQLTEEQIKNFMRKYGDAMQSVDLSELYEAGSASSLERQATKKEEKERENALREEISTEFGI